MQASMTSKVVILWWECTLAWSSWGLLPADLGSAVSEHFKMTVVKRVMEAYAACAIQLAQLLHKKSAHQREQAESQPDALLLAAELNHAVTALLDRGGAAHEASMKDVLASKWLPP